MVLCIALVDAMIDSCDLFQPDAELRCRGWMGWMLREELTSSYETRWKEVISHWNEDECREKRRMDDQPRRKMECRGRRWNSRLGDDEWG